MSDILFSFSFAFAFQEVFFFVPTTGPSPDSWPSPIPVDRRGFPTTCFHQARFTTMPPTENPFPLFLARGGIGRGNSLRPAITERKEKDEKRGGSGRKSGKSPGHIFPLSSFLFLGRGERLFCLINEGATSSIPWERRRGGDNMPLIFGGSWNGEGRHCPTSYY